MTHLPVNTPFFLFDVESIGLHGEGFAVAGGVYVNGVANTEFRFSCQPERAQGEDTDRAWVRENVPAMEITHQSLTGMRDAFWTEWKTAKKWHPGIVMAGECIFPVEAGFVANCIYDDMPGRKWEGPYPLHEVSSILLAAGMDPLKTYDRLESELPAHEPLADTRLTARLLAEALGRLRGEEE